MLDREEIGASSWDTDAVLNINTMKSKVNKNVYDAIAFLDDASRYHGYKDPTAQQYINYTLAADPIVYDTPVPHGFVPKVIDPNNTAAMPNYKAILGPNNICNWVNNFGVREVWVFMYQSQSVVPEESRMVSSRYGDVGNSDNEDALHVSAQFRTPQCNHSYTIYDYNYTRDLPEMIHDHMHQWEYLAWYAANDTLYGDGDVPAKQEGLFWGDYASFGHTSNGCGWTHMPPNKKDDQLDTDKAIRNILKHNSQAYDEYNYDDKTYVESNCQNWSPDHSQSKYEKISCTAWGCTDMGFYKWWMQNLPGYGNTILYKGKGMRNWWDLLVDFDGFMAQGRTLFCKNGYCSGYKPASQPKPTVIPLVKRVSIPTPKPMPNSASCQAATKNTGTCVPSGECKTEGKVVSGVSCLAAGYICCLPNKASSSSKVNTNSAVASSSLVYSGGHDPIGYVNSNASFCSEHMVGGWACAKDQPNVPVYVDLYMDGPYGQGKFLTRITANQSGESAIGQFCNGTTNHRFSFLLSDPKLAPLFVKRSDGKPHKVYVHAIGGGNPLLGSSGQNFTCTNNCLAHGGTCTTSGLKCAQVGGKTTTAYTCSSGVCCVSQ